MRHGSAENDIRGILDKDRNLTEDGIREVLLKGIWLNTNNFVLDFILSSDAARTKQTTNLIAEKCNLEESKIEFSNDLYNASLGKMIDQLAMLNNKYDTIMLVAHNPGVSYLSEYLTGNYVSFEPSTLQIIELKITDWNFITKNSGKSIQTI